MAIGNIWLRGDNMYDISDSVCPRTGREKERRKRKVIRTVNDLSQKKFQVAYLHSHGVKRCRNAELNHVSTGTVVSYLKFVYQNLNVRDVVELRKKFEEVGL